MVIFAPQNLIMDPPFTKLDILTCRNLLIYLSPEVQKKLIPLFHYSLRPGGILFLGSAEAIGTQTGLFVSLSAKSRLFRRKEPALPPGPVEFPSSYSTFSSAVAEMRQAPKAPASVQCLADQLVLQRYAPPAVLVNDQGDIYYISGRTGKFLEPAAGKANWNLFAMARNGLRCELAHAFQKALRQKEQVVLHGLQVSHHEGNVSVDVTIERIEEAGPLRGMVMIVFTEVAAPPPAPAAIPGHRVHHPSARLAELEGELQQVRAEARATHEEMQTTQEELRSANEELQSMNEELQSMNEELTTSKEEMQSMNEELQTLNSELQAKVDELSRASNDMKNLLESTDIATLFLDRQLNVRRFTTQAAHLIKLIPGDVGRPITDLALNLNPSSLVNDVHEVLRTSVSKENPAATRDGRWFNVCIMPYRTLDDRIDGVVITFADITAAKTLETKLRAKQTELEKQLAGRASPAKATSRKREETAESNPTATRLGPHRTAGGPAPAHD